MTVRVRTEPEAAPGSRPATGDISVHPGAWSARAERFGPALLAALLVLSCNVRTVGLGGGFDLRPFDPAWLCVVALAAAATRERGGLRRLSVRRPSGDGGVAVVAGAVFVASVVVSAVVLALTGRGGADELASAARVVQIAVVVPVAAVLLSSPNARARFLAALVAGLGVTAAVYALVNAGVLPVGALLGSNPGKAASGPVIVALLAACVAAPVARPVRVLAALTGAAAVVYAVSMTADLVLAVGAAVATWFVTGWAGRRTVVRVGASVLAATLVGTLGVVGLKVLRPDALPERISAPLTLRGRPAGPSGGPAAPGEPVVGETVEGAGGATILHRAILMSAAARVFASSPLVGVGWTRADDPGIVDDPAVVRFTKDLFDGGSRTMYTDVVPTNAHNAFLQAFAELGIVGGVALLVFAVASVAAGVEAVRRRRGRAPVALSALLLVLSGAGFLCFTGFYPTQPETVVPALGLGFVLAELRR